MSYLIAQERVTVLEASVQESNIILTWMVSLAYHTVCFVMFHVVLHAYECSQAPPPSLRPPVVTFWISHNITDGAMAIQTMDPFFTFENLDPGTYLFSVWAVNVLGDGEKAEVIAG